MKLFNKETDILGNGCNAATYYKEAYVHNVSLRKNFEKIKRKFYLFTLNFVVGKKVHRHEPKSEPFALVFNASI